MTDRPFDPKNFTSLDFSRRLCLSIRSARKLLAVLTRSGVVEYSLHRKTRRYSLSVSRLYLADYHTL